MPRHEGSGLVAYAGGGAFAPVAHISARHSRFGEKAKRRLDFNAGPLTTSVADDDSVVDSSD